VIGHPELGKAYLKLMGGGGALKPDREKCLLIGDDINLQVKKTFYNVRKKFGFLFQGAALLDSLTVAENVGLGLAEHRSVSKNEIRRLFRKAGYGGLVGVEDFFFDLFRGIEKRVGLHVL